MCVISTFLANWLLNINRDRMKEVRKARKKYRNNKKKLRKETRKIKAQEKKANRK